MSIRGVITKLSAYIDKISCYFVIFLTIALTATIFFEVFFRYVIKNPLIMTEELSRYTMIWLTFVAAPVALRRKAHVGMDILKKYYSGRKNMNILKILSQLIIIIFLLFLIYFGCKHVLEVQSQISAALRISMSWPFLSIPIGGFLMLIQQIALMLDDKN